MEIGAAQVEVAAPGSEQRGGDAIDDDAGAGDRHDDSARHRLRIAEAAQRLPRQRADGDQQQRGVEQRGQNRRAAQTVGEPRVGARLANTAASQAIANASTSLKLWPASESSATEWAKTPPAASATTKAALSATPMAKARPKSATAPGVVADAVTVVVVVVVAVGMHAPASVPDFAIETRRRRALRS